jgi:hypothetical protein
VSSPLARKKDPENIWPQCLNIMVLVKPATVIRKVIPVRARPATAEEKKRVWPIMTAQWPDFDTYQAGTKRDIPVVLLTPR